MVRIFRALADERRFKKLGHTVHDAKDYTPAVSDRDYVPKNDVPWMTRFVQDGGQVIISGNTTMPEVAHELLAIQSLGLVAIFFERKWNGWDFYRKSALLLAAWPSICDQLRTAKPGSIYRIPNDFRDEAKLRMLPDPGELRLQEERAVEPRRAKASRAQLQPRSRDGIAATTQGRLKV